MGEAEVLKKTLDNKQNEYGQIRITLLGQKYEIPFKVRISGNFIPDITIDPKLFRERVKRTRGFDLMSIIKPKVVVLIGNKAFEIDYLGNVREVDPNIFNRPTVLDQLSFAGVGPLAVFLAGIAFFTFSLFKASRKIYGGRI